MFFIVTLVSLFIFVILVASGIAYAIQAQIIGRSAAWRNLRQVVPLFLLGFLLAFVLGCLGSNFIGSFPTTIGYGWLLIFVSWLMVFTYLATWPWRKKEASFLLLDVGRLSIDKVFFAASGIELLVAIMQMHWLINELNNEFYTSDYWLIWDLCSIFNYCFIAFFFFLLGKSRIEFREKGICSNYTLIKWNKVFSYKWKGKNGNTLTMQTKTNFPLLRYWNWSIPIPATKKDAVEQILSQQVSGEREDRPYEAS